MCVINQKNKISEEKPTEHSNDVFFKNICMYKKIKAKHNNVLVLVLVVVIIEATESVEQTEKKI